MKTFMICFIFITRSRRLHPLFSIYVIIIQNVGLFYNRISRFTEKATNIQIFLVGSATPKPILYFKLKSCTTFGTTQVFQSPEVVVVGAATSSNKRIQSSCPFVRRFLTGYFDKPRRMILLTCY